MHAIESDRLYLDLRNVYYFLNFTADQNTFYKQSLNGKKRCLRTLNVF